MFTSTTFRLHPDSVFCIHVMFNKAFDVQLSELVFYIILGKSLQEPRAADIEADYPGRTQHREKKTSISRGGYRISERGGLLNC